MKVQLYYVCLILESFTFCTLRYLLELSRKSDEVPDPNTDAITDQWVEWESVSLQVCHDSMGGVVELSTY